MYRASLAAPDDFDGWRATARGFALAGVDPADIVWQVGGDDGDLFASDAPPPVAAEGTFGHRFLEKNWLVDALETSGTPPPIR